MRFAPLILSLGLADAIFEYFEQPLQHDVTNSPTFMQKYSYNKFGEGPMMVYIGGEGPMTTERGKNELITTMARDFEGSLLSVEHRFYGESMPENGDDSDVMLKGLYTDEAMKDLVKIIKAKQIHPKQPVIVFGCSYPGVISVWIRKNYPELITGAISSSAPIVASPSFPQFDAAITRVYGRQCTTDANFVLSAVERALERDVVGVSKILGCTMAAEQLSSDPKNLRLGVLHAISEYYVYPVQNDDGDRKNKFCEIMRNGVEEVEDLVSTSWQTEGEIELSVTVDNMLLETMIKMMKWEESWKMRSCDEQNMMLMTSENAKKERSPSKPQGGALAKLRGWNFQSCAEFAFWQITTSLDPSQAARSKELTVKDFYERACSVEFGGTWDAEEVTSKVNLRYKGRDIVNLEADGGLGVTNVHFTNGGVDPWAELGMTALPSALLDRFNNDESKLQRERGVSVHLIPSASHCNDFSDVRPPSHPVGEAQDKIRKAIARFLLDVEDERTYEIRI